MAWCGVAGRSVSTLHVPHLWSTAVTHQAAVDGPGPHRVVDGSVDDQRGAVEFMERTEMCQID